MIMPYSHNVKSAYAYAYMTIDYLKIVAVRHLISFVQWIQQLLWYAISQAICSLLPNEHMRTVTNVDSDIYCATLSDSSGLNNLKANHFIFRYHCYWAIHDITTTGFQVVKIVPLSACGL